PPRRYPHLRRPASHRSRQRETQRYKMNCIFCKIIARQRPGYIITEDENIIVFVSLENHPIVAPREHIPDLFDLNDDLASMVMKMAKKVALATKEGLDADGIYVTQTNGAAAGQSVFHYHMHIYPKWNDGRRLETDAESRERTMGRVRKFLE